VLHDRCEIQLEIAVVVVLEVMGLYQFVQPTLVALTIHQKDSEMEPSQIVNQLAFDEMELLKVVLVMERGHGLFVEALVPMGVCWEMGHGRNVNLLVAAVDWLECHCDKAPDLEVVEERVSCLFAKEDICFPEVGKLYEQQRELVEV
jgi:hypothetical protein